ncbi:hypothetical protein XENOCAPTIV_007932, partial [Xenoophorus captivus]
QRPLKSITFSHTKHNQEPVFSKDGTRFFLTVPVKQGGRGEFHHIAMSTTQVRLRPHEGPNQWMLSIHSLVLEVHEFREDQNEVRHLTSGNWEVTRIIAYDENSDNL